MKRKSLYALALLLCLSSVAFSNERARFWCRTSGKTGCPAAAAAANPTTAAATRAARTAAAAAEESTNGSENHMFLHTFIKLLYI
jgi:hypothetical protein